MFKCRNCAVDIDAPTPCVMRHEISSSVGDTAGITQDVGQDPTVGLTRSFSTTTLQDDGHGNHGTDDNDFDFGIDIPPVCTMCGEEIICITCGEEPAPGIALETLDQDSGAAQVQEQTHSQTEGTSNGGSYANGNGNANAH